ncbi:MAG: hypothetical protein EA422_02315 [Gemmatimonadales bacterium]|nr:MAG: hypothetical protein EA422_02315 [Gemmatimonadales bacterium]
MSRDLRWSIGLLITGLCVALLSFLGNSPPAFMTFIAAGVFIGGAGFVLALRFLMKLSRSRPGPFPPARP